MEKYLIKKPKLSESKSNDLNVPSVPSSSMQGLNFSENNSSSVLVPNLANDISEYAGKHIPNCEKVDVLNNFWKPEIDYSFPITTKNNRICMVQQVSPEM